MSPEVSGGLIQMTAHMVLTRDARTTIWLGAATALVFGLLAVCAAVSGKRKHKRRYVLIFAVTAILGAALLIAGARSPMKKVLYCCADGPVDLQMVAAKYDIIAVDGKFVKMAER